MTPSPKKTKRGRPAHPLDEYNLTEADRASVSRVVVELLRPDPYREREAFDAALDAKLELSMNEWQSKASADRSLGRKTVRTKLEQMRHALKKALNAVPEQDAATWAFAGTVTPHIEAALAEVETFIMALPKREPPRPNVERKRAAARVARDLLLRFDRPTKTTKTSALCRLAAELYGTPRAYVEFHHACREVMAEWRETGKK